MAGAAGGDDDDDVDDNKHHSSKSVLHIDMSCLCKRLAFLHFFGGGASSSWSGRSAAPPASFAAPSPLSAFPSSALSAFPSSPLSAFPSSPLSAFGFRLKRSCTPSAVTRPNFSLGVAPVAGVSSPSEGSWASSPAKSAFAFALAFPFAFPFAFGFAFAFPFPAPYICNWVRLDSRSCCKLRVCMHSQGPLASCLAAFSSRACFLMRRCSSKISRSGLSSPSSIS